MTRHTFTAEFQALRGRRCVISAVFAIIQAPKHSHEAISLSLYIYIYIYTSLSLSLSLSLYIMNIYIYIYMYILIPPMLTLRSYITANDQAGAYEVHAARQEPPFKLFKSCKWFKLRKFCLNAST